jgi:molybdate transport system substrate-binding protein
MWKRRFGIPIVIAVTAALALAGCGSGGDKAAGSSTPTASTKTLTVLAAASLTETFNQLGKTFEQAHLGTKVVFSYGGSSTLAQQITQGAPADVFASASPATMKTVTDAGDASGTPQVFVRNQLVIAVPSGDPKGIKSLSDLTKPGLKVVLCAEAVPCGAAAKKALAAANVKLTPVSLEQDVKSALNKVTIGEADAALVYRTDAEAAGGKVQGIEFPESAQAINDYPIVALKSSKNPDLANQFVQFIESPDALAVLTAAGFQAP